MLTRRFGRTNLAMPVLSCGGMRYQFKWQDMPQAQIPAASQQNLEATIERALSLGINHIETARGYGSSERQLGQILPRYPRESLIVQTKVTPCADPAQFESNVVESLQRLQLDHVDLLSVHGVNSEQDYAWATEPGGCFDRAQALRERGLCRFVGVSTHGDPDLVQRLVRYDGSTGAGFDYINLHWYFIFQRNWEAIAEAQRRDKGVFIISPSDKGGKLYAPPEKLVRLCSPLSPMLFNDLFCLSHPEVHTLSIGASRPSDFDEHVKVLPLLENASEFLAPILQRLAETMREATGNADPEACVPGLPAWERTYGGYNLPIILWLRNLVKGWDMREYGAGRFNLLGNADTWFPGERPRTAADIDDAALIQSLGTYAQASQVPDWLRDALQMMGGQDLRRGSQSD